MITESVIKTETKRQLLKSRFFVSFQNKTRKTNFKSYKNLKTVFSEANLPIFAKCLLIEEREIIEEITVMGTVGTGEVVWAEDRATLEPLLPIFKKR